MFSGSVDVPLLDEWDCWWTNAPGKTLAWLFERHNEHRIVFTKLEFLLIDALARGNEIWLNAFNYALFGALLVVFYRLVTRLDSNNKYAGWFFVFLLSSLPYENHTWGFQSQFHFTLIFFLLSLPLLFESSNWKSQLAGAALLVASIFSFSSGVVTALAVIVFYALVKIFRRENLGRTAVTIVIVAVAIFLWSRGFARHVGHPDRFYPWQGKFWQFYFAMISFGFGIGKSGPVWGAVAFALCVSAWGAWWFRKRRNREIPNPVGVAATLGILAALAAIASGRAGFPLWVAKSSRYTEMSLLLVPLTAVGMGLAWGRDEKRRRLISLLLFFCLLITFSKKFSPIAFRDEWTRRTEGKNCLKNYFGTGEGNAYCPQIFPVPLADRLKMLELAHPSFMDDIRGGM